jgi:SAM-dependent methyltransferase
MNDLDFETYKKLYAKYLRGSRTKEMVDLAGNLEGKKVLDLCCGGCRLTKEVKKRKPLQILSVDESLKMIPSDFKITFSIFQKWDIETYPIFCGSVKRALTDLGSNSIDVIFCQQAINYWFSQEYVELIKNVLTSNGLFIFNTFNKKPSTIPITKKYYYEKTGQNYVEISWLVGNIVKHVQIADGMDPHFTEFQWIPPEKFKRLLKDFKINVITDNSTDIYICRTK